MIIVEIGRILPTEAAVIINASPQFVRIAMQRGLLPIGTAVKMSTKWTYNISPKLLADYTGKDIDLELKKIRGIKEESGEENKNGELIEKL